jgi:hypothetical protein
MPPGLTNLGVSARETPSPGSAGTPATTHFAASTTLTPGLIFQDFQLTERQGQTPLGELWLARGADGLDYRALALCGSFAIDDAVLARLQALEHPELPPSRVFRTPCGRVVMVTDRYEGTLADCFDVCTASGERGIPRTELLRYLRSAAEALDVLRTRTGLSHLGLNPRNLLVDGDRLLLAEFGLVPLVWMGAGQLPAQLNARYAALELYEGHPHPTSDQYGLALIYAEMVSGFHPRPRVSSSGLHRRGSAGARPTARLDLDLLPSCDRDVITRALSPDPAQRFGSCCELIDALDEAAGRSRNNDLLPVIPAVRLLNPRAPLPAQLPAIEDLVAEVAAESETSGQGGLPPPASGCVDGMWEYRYPIRVIPGATTLKVHGFSEHWGAEILEERGNTFLLHLEVPEDAVGKRLPGRRRTLEIRLEVRPPEGKGAGLTEAYLSIRPLSRSDSNLLAVVDQMGPRLIDSLRNYLCASPERRCEERWSCPLPLRVYPVVDGQGVGKPLAAVSKNLSRSGVQFLLEQPLEVSQVYLHWYRSTRAGGFALLAQVARVRQIGGTDGLEVGAFFPAAIP